MSMSGFVIKYQDINDILWGYEKNLKSLISNIGSLQTSIEKFINNPDFTGESASAIKCYLEEVHITLLSSLQVTAQNMLDNIALYKAGYYNIDGTTNFILPEEFMQEFRSALKGRLKDVEEQGDDVDKEISNISDLISFSYPDRAGVVDSHSEIDQKIVNLIANISQQESSTVLALENSTEVLVSSLKTCIAKVGTNWSDIQNYTSNSFFSDKDVYALAYLSQAFYEQHEENKEIFEEIWDVEAQIAAEAEARKTEGIWKTVGGVALVAAGAACIIFTAGAATPIVVAGVVAGGGTIGFGIADSAEGAQEIYYGSIGDIDSQSINYLKSVVFQGNEQAYQITESVFAFTASALVPIGKAAKVGELTFRSGVVTIGKLGLSTAAGSGASKITMDVTENRVASMIAGMAASTIMGFGLNALDEKYFISTGSKSGLHRGMDYSNASKKLETVDFKNMAVEDINKCLKEVESIGLKSRDVARLQTQILQSSGFTNFDLRGDLADITAFTPGSLVVEEFNSPQTLYRRGYPTEGTEGYSYGKWWSEVQMSMDEAREQLAILENWGNPLTGEYQMEVPAGTRSISGIAASQ